MAGFPRSGLEGSAIASVVTALAMMLAYAAIIQFDRKLRRYRLFGRWWRPEWPRMVEIAKLGAPIALTFTLEGALFGGAAFLMGLIGVVEVAAHAIALNIAAIAFQVPFGIAQAATIRVGMAYGAADRAWIGRAGWAAIVTGTGFMALTATAIWLAPQLFVSVYVDVERAGARAAKSRWRSSISRSARCSSCSTARRRSRRGRLRGLQDTRMPMMIAGFGYWVAGFGTAIFLGFHAHGKGSASGSAWRSGWRSCPGCWSRAGRCASGWGCCRRTPPQGLNLSSQPIDGAGRAPHMRPAGTRLSRVPNSCNSSREGYQQ